MSNKQPISTFLGIAAAVVLGPNGHAGNNIDFDGFAVNTLFYTTILWLLIPSPFALRRFLRLRRGLCPKCAYPMGESYVCTECGEALPNLT